MKAFLNNINIGTRVGVGFLILLSILVAITVYNISAWMRSQSLFNHYAETSDNTIQILNVSHKVSELQRAILAYSHTGNHGVIKRANEFYVKLTTDLSGLKNTNDDSEISELLVSMSNILSQYGQNIESLVELRSRRDSMTKELMGSLMDNTLKMIGTVQSMEWHAQELSIPAQSTELREMLLKAQFSVASFLYNRDYESRKFASNYLAESLDLVSQWIGMSDVSKSKHTILLNLNTNISKYQSSFYQVLQATRDYIFLVNVVMAGLASEFSSLSNQLKNMRVSILNEVTQSTRNQSINVRNSMLWFMTLGIVISVLLAIILNRSLSSPITAITQTFKTLAQGDRVNAIPGLDREDEIGELANAANVFKETNERTKKILHKSQQLTLELKIREKKLEEQSALLKKSNDELDNFAYIASHDLKSPLRAIDNLCQWVIEDCINIIPKESREHLRKMQQRVKRMDNLLSDLLNYSRVGRVATQIKPVNLNCFISDLVAMLDKPESFTIHFDRNLPILTTAEAPLKQVFLNLLTNAVNYRKKDNGNVWVRYKELHSGYIEFSVIDDGPGIDEKFHERIFKMFQSLNRRDAIESSGMGLAIIKKVVESQNGEIRVISQPGQGATFIFTWPSQWEKNTEVA